MTLGFARLGSLLRSVSRGRGGNRVLFGERPDWHEMIGKVLDGSTFQFDFGDLRSCDLSRYDLIVPLKLGDYAALRARQDEARSRALFPDPEAVAVCDDKALFNRRMCDSGLGDLVPTVFDSMPSRFPFILKRRQDEYGVHSHLVKGPDDVERLGACVASDDYFMQDYVDGRMEYTTHILLRDGEIKYFVNVVFDMEEDRYVKGVNFTARSTTLNSDPRLIDTCADVVRAAGFMNGTCCVNYKLSAGRMKIFEMNPRFGGTLTNDLGNYLRAYGKAV